MELYHFFIFIGIFALGLSLGLVRKKPAGKNKIK